MEDLEAKREARRRRILQSSEDRMNRVMGLQRSTGVDSQIPAESKAKEAVPSDISIDGTASEVRQRKPASETVESRPEAKAEEVVKSPRNTVKITPLKKQQTAIDSNVQTPTNDSLNTSRSTSEAKMMLKHFEFLRIVLCFIVAFLCRRVLATGYGIFYVQSIVVPFACMEAGFFMFKHKVLHNVILPHRSSMLVGVLMLCGMKPNIVQLYNKTMGYMTAASEDFALFFFAFMMANTFLV